MVFALRRNSPGARLPAAGCETCLALGGLSSGYTLLEEEMLYRLLATVDAWLYAWFDRVSALFVEDLAYPEERDCLASLPSGAPLLARLPAQTETRGRPLAS